MPTIFISYRRQDSADAAGRIYDKLEAHFGRSSVFIDVDSIPPGPDFRSYLIDAVSGCDVVLAIVGETWLTGRDAQGNRRLNNEDDFVRIELETALKRDVLLIPVLVGRASMPEEESLPPELKEFAYRNAIRVQSGPYFNDQVDRLIRSIVDQCSSRPRWFSPEVLAKKGATAATLLTAVGTIIWLLLFSDVDSIEMETLLKDSRPELTEAPAADSLDNVSRAERRAGEDENPENTQDAEAAETNSSPSPADRTAPPIDSQTPLAAEEKGPAAPEGDVDADPLPDVTEETEAVETPLDSIEVGERAAPGEPPADEPSEDVHWQEMENAVRLHARRTVVDLKNALLQNENWAVIPAPLEKYREHGNQLRRHFQLRAVEETVGELRVDREAQTIAVPVRLDIIYRNIGSDIEKPFTLDAQWTWSLAEQTPLLSNVRFGDPSPHP